MNQAAIVQKLWNYCNVLRDDGMSYGDYPGSSPGQANNEQLTYLLFLKMADERTKAPYNQKSPVPSMYSWPSHAPTLTVPARAYMDRVRPFGGEKVHWTFSCFRLAPSREGGKFFGTFCLACG